MIDLGEIMRGEGGRYLQTHLATSLQRKAIQDIANCRTPAMGAVTNSCDDCSGEYRLFRSCRNRSCPSCQGERRWKWLEARRQEILPGPYSQMVFANPGELKVLARFCPAVMFSILMRAAAQAIIDVGRSKLGVQLGCLAQLQTWTQLLAWYVHVHYVVPCGGFSLDGSRWISFEPKDFPVAALRKRFRTLLCKYVQAAARKGKFEGLPATVSIDALLEKVMNRELKVYVGSPFGGPEKLLAYLARYMYRVAITNDRIESYENDHVTFQWRDCRRGNQLRSFRARAIDFVRRFVTHVPPKGFVRVRSYGFLGNRNRKQNLEKARQLIGQAEPPAARKELKPLRLCPACAAKRQKGPLHFAPNPETAPQLDLLLRPPPNHPVAA